MNETVFNSDDATMMLASLVTLLAFPLAIGAATGVLRLVLLAVSAAGLFTSLRLRWEAMTREEGEA